MSPCLSFCVAKAWIFKSISKICLESSSSLSFSAAKDKTGVAVAIAKRELVNFRQIRTSDSPFPQGTEY